MNRDKMNCANCDFYWPIMNSIGQCCLAPPKPTSAGASPQDVIPEVTPDYSCGQWKPEGFTELSLATAADGGDA